MDDRIRLRHHAGKSVRDFCKGHPSDVEGYTTTVAELGTGLDRMDDLFSQFETGRREFSAAKKEQDRILALIHHEFLLPIAGIARGNGALDPALARRFRAPEKGKDKTAYIGAARSIMALAGEHEAVFIRDGMQPAFVEEFGKSLDAYDATAAAANANRQLHVQARAELKVQAKQVMALIKRLDGINRTLYRKNPHTYQAWLAARNVAWPAVAQVRPEGTKQDKSAA